MSTFIARRTDPSRSLLDQRKPHRYTPSVHTDVAATIAKFRRLQAMQLLRGSIDYPDDSDCNEVNAAGTYKG